MKFEDEFRYDKQKYWIIVNFFDSMLRHNFIKILNYMGKDISYGGEVTGYNFPSSADEEDGDYFDNGVMFYFNDNDIVIKYEMFVDCLELAAKIYYETGISNEDKVIIANNIEMIKKRYNV
jgi:hypothetical protein